MQKRHRFTAVYLVGWDDDLIIKTGFATKKGRWRAFEIRGATLYGVSYLPNAVAVEIETHSFLAFGLPGAFGSRTDAVQYLAGQGGGYLECFRAPDQATYRFAIEQCLDIMHLSIAPEHSSEKCLRTDETDGLTKTRASVADNLNVLNAHEKTGN